MRTLKEEKAVGIHFDSATLHMSRMGNITGIISLRVGDGAFPEEQWNDFPVSILEMWLTAAARLWIGSTKTERFHFMDGPFWFDAERRDDIWSLRCQNDRGTAGPVLEASAHVSSKSLLSEMISCAERVLAACRSKGWVSRDLDELEASIARAKSLSSKA